MLDQEISSQYEQTLHMHSMSEQKDFMHCGATHETATIDQIPPHASGLDKNFKAECEHINVPVSFSPNPQQSGLQGISGFQMDSFPVPNTDKDEMVTVHTRQTSYATSVEVELLQAIPCEAHSPLDDILLDTRPRPMKLSSMRTTDTVSVKSSKLDTVAGQILHTGLFLMTLLINAI